jgi:hypothetical protein
MWKGTLEARRDWARARAEMPASIMRIGFVVVKSILSALEKRKRKA